MTKRLSLILVILCVATFSFPAFAYRLPPCQISAQERAESAEDVLKEYQSEMSELLAPVNVARLEEHRRNPKIKLCSNERKAAKRYEELIVKIRFWEDVTGLKNSLSSLHGENPPDGAVTEADQIAKDVIETLYDISQKWKVGSALFTNLLINMGLKEKGFCYHYAANLRKVLLKRTWRFFDIRWGTAWAKTFRENNSLVITSKGRPFEEGLAIDAWRTAGRPFWTPVKGDSFPWVEETDVENRNAVE